MICTHESILKLISYRFRFGYLTKRHRYASNIGRSFDFRHPKFDPPEIPDPAAVMSKPCSLGGSSRSAERPKPHDLVRLETSGYLDSLGYEVKPATPDRIFSEPDSIKRAARASEIYGVGVREQASSNLDVIRQTYELGSKTLLDYIAEQRRFIELENGYIDALLETYQARVEIQRAASEPKLIALTEVK